MRHRGRRAGALALAAVVGTSSFLAIPAAPGLAAPGKVTEIGLPVPDVAPLGIANGPNGSVWFAENGGGVGRIDGAGKITEYPVAANSQKNLGIPDAMAAGSDGSLWFTDISVSVPRVGRVDPATGASTLYELPLTGAVNFTNAQVTSITPGADGAMWFTGGYSGALGRIDASGTVTAYATGLTPYAVTIGQDGAVWFTNNDASIGRLDPATGKVTSYTAPSAGTGLPALGEIVPGPDGRLWFTEPGVGKIGALNPSDGQIAEYAVPTADSKPTGIVAGTDGRLWFTESAASNVGSIDPASGSVTEHPLPATLSSPMRIMNGPGGELWFTSPGRGKIGHLDPAAPPSGTPNQSVPPLSAGYPNNAARFQNQCPRGSVCQTQVTTGGSVKIGTFEQELPSGAIRITGYLGDPDETGEPVLMPPVTGKQFESAPVEVPGGMIGQLPLIGPILGKTPAAMWAVNRLTVTQSLAGPIHVFVTDTGIGAKASLNVKLNNTLLGDNCVIGPIEAKLAPTFRSGGLALDPQLGWVAAQIGIDAPIAVPAAKGCGPWGILDGVINQMMGLPADPSKNSMNLTGVMALGSGINASNVPGNALRSGPVAAKAGKILKQRQAKHATRKAPKKVTLKLKARR